jgi:hypothetical protein
MTVHLLQTTSGSVAEVLSTFTQTQAIPTQRRPIVKYTDIDLPEAKSDL